MCVNRPKYYCPLRSRMYSNIDSLLTNLGLGTIIAKWQRAEFPLKQLIQKKRYADSNLVCSKSAQRHNEITKEEQIKTRKT